MKSPRIQVSLDEQLYKTIHTIAKGTDQSASGLIASMLTDQREVLSQIACAVETARKLSQPLSGTLTVRLAHGEALARQDAHHAQAKLDDLNDDLLDELQSQSETQTRGAKRASGRASDPLPINKGVFKLGSRGLTE